MMIKHALCASLLLLCAAAQADEPHWTFTYSGFYIAGEHRFDPGSELVGTFTGTDLNHDKLIDKAELTSLNVGYFSFAACPNGYPYHYDCAIDAFSFNTANNSLQFSASSGWTDDNNGSGVALSIVTGDKVTTYTHPWHAPDHSVVKYWTPETTLAVTGPVPEPAAYALLAAGLCAIAWRRRTKT
ncbi:MAG TPA: PEP-CTERM sorting domain-containing protein [Telluria sp.]|nr:PEP-CTERM sorting domain-containing protein [Telluria sp.]